MESFKIKKALYETYAIPMCGKVAENFRSQERNEEKAKQFLLPFT
jgi:hypothetical protein